MPVILSYAAVKSFDPNINNIFHLSVYCESLDCMYGN